VGRSNSLRIQILHCQIMMASKQKNEIEKAINIQTDVLTTERDYIPAIYGTAVGFMLLKQTPRARNQLKRLSKNEWNSEFGDELEKSWLLLADIYIQGGKYDLAMELLKKVTSVNQSCSKAWEYLGLIMEKEQAYKDAAENYAKCWALEKNTNPTIGFKLAFNYLKAKRFTDAIDISHLVLHSYPDYPKIKVDILDKARNNLRFP
jgi:tetratricopeptide (TPR) repeat protein